MPVIEPEPHGVVADWLYRGDGDLELAELQGLLPRPVAAHFSRRRVDTQVLEGQRVLGAVVERHYQQPRLRAEAYIRDP